MKLKLLSASVLLLAGTAVFAASSQQKIATVNMETLGQTNVCQAPIKSLQTEYKSQFAAIQKQASELQNSKEQADQEKLAKLSEQYQQLQQEIEVKAQSADNACIDAIMTATKQVADKDGYTVVIPESSTLYAAHSIDITPTVETALNVDASKQEKVDTTKPNTK